MAEQLTEKKRHLQRLGALKTERSSWDAHYQDVAKFLSPRTGRFFVTDRNKGEKRQKHILNDAGGIELRRMAANITAGANSPARNWFGLRVPNKAVDELPSVRAFWDKGTQIAHDVLRASNVYEVLEQMHEENGGYGTAVACMVPDDERVVVLQQATVGEYYLATNNRGQINTLYREFEMSVAALVEEFGIENVSEHAKRLHEQNNLEAGITVLHVIEPRKKRDPTKLDNRNMEFASVYLETNGNEDKLLRESGFPRFPALTPRWSVRGNDAYGRGPGMDALGDVKGLQHLELVKSQGAHKQADPATNVPSAAKDREVDLLPGGRVPFDPAGGANAKATPVYAGDELNLQNIHLLIQQAEERIARHFFADVFQVVIGEDKSMTAHEVAVRVEERLQLVGPVIERMQNELHKPLIEYTVARCIETGRIDITEAPEELLAEWERNGGEYSIEFESTLAQAQKAVPIAAVDRWLTMLGAVAKIQAEAGGEPDVLDNADFDILQRDYGMMLGPLAKFMRDPKAVQAIREARNAARAAEAQAAIAAQQAKAVKDLATAPLDQGSVLDGMAQVDGISGVTGYQTGPPRFAGAA